MNFGVRWPVSALVGRDLSRPRYNGTTERAKWVASDGSTLSVPLITSESITHPLPRGGTDLMALVHCFAEEHVDPIEGYSAAADY